MKCYKDKELKDGVDTKIQFVGYEDIDIDGMTMHKAKGLSSDEVILIGLDQHFPSEYGSSYWLTNLFKPDGLEEKIPFSEERRLFYVALTRTKNYVYLLVNKNPKLRSTFVNEIYHTIEEMSFNKKIGIILFFYLLFQYFSLQIVYLYCHLPYYIVYYNQPSFHQMYKIHYLSYRHDVQVQYMYHKIVLKNQ